MAAPFNAGEYVNRAYANLSAKQNRTMVISTAVVGILAFAAMITSAYTADHINHSSCDRTKDKSLASAYQWSWGTAVITGFTAAGMVGILVYTAIKEKKTA